MNFILVYILNTDWNQRVIIIEITSEKHGCCSKKMWFLEVFFGLKTGKARAQNKQMLTIQSNGSISMVANKKYRFTLINKSIDKLIFFLFAELRNLFIDSRNSRWSEQKPKVLCYVSFKQIRLQAFFTRQNPKQTYPLPFRWVAITLCMFLPFSTT